MGYLGYLIGSKDENSNYYIVSKDKGYLSSINLLKNLSKNKCHIELISDILTISHNLYNVYSDPILNLEEEIIVELKSYGYTNKTVTKALIAIGSSYDLESLKLGWNKKILNICEPIVNQYYSNFIA